MSVSYPRTGRLKAARRAASPARWPLSLAACLARKLVQRPGLDLLDLLVPTRVYGLERLDGLAGPALFVANHTSHLDSPVILRALPSGLRERVTIAAAADYFFRSPLLGGFVALALNAFPFTRDGSAHRALEHCEELLDAGWSVLMYPEGTRTATGEIGRFRPGAALVAVQTGVPVVPVYVGGLFDVMPKGRALPRRGRASVTFGEPMRFEEGTRPDEAIAAIEAAVRRLACDGEGR
jgi:1-acyl-sn-glycerol-3-phosphate acyltransferase